MIRPTEIAVAYALPRAPCHILSVRPTTPGKGTSVPETIMVILIVLSLLGLGYLRVVRPRMSQLSHNPGKALIGPRDVVFDGVPLGVLPAADMPTRSATAQDRSVPVTVRFEPPQDVRPEQTGMLRSGLVTGQDVTAAFVALVVDGYVHLEQVPHPSEETPPQESQWTLATVGPPPHDGLRGWLYELIADLEEPAVVADLAWRLRIDGPGAREDYAGIPRHREWYPKMKNRGGHYPPLGARVRSAEAVALRYQLAGFREFLETADGSRLRFEEGAGLFSRYLPWAVALNLTRQWVTALEQATHGLDPVVRERWERDLGWLGTDLVALSAINGLALDLDMIGDASGGGDWGSTADLGGFDGFDGGAAGADGGGGN